MSQPPNQSHSHSATGHIATTTISRAEHLTAKVPLALPGSRVSIPVTGQVARHIIGTTGHKSPLVHQVHVTQIPNPNATAQPLTTHVIPKLTSTKIPSTGSDIHQAIHTVTLGQAVTPGQAVTSDHHTPVTSTHFTRMLSTGGQLAGTAVLHATGSLGPQQQQQLGLATGQSAHMASIICSGGKAPRLAGGQSTQLIQAFPSHLPRGAAAAAALTGPKAITTTVLRPTGHGPTTAPTAAPAAQAILSHIATRGQIIAPLRTTTPPSNRPNSPAVTHGGVSITVPATQITDTHKYRSSGGHAAHTSTVEIQLQPTRGAGTVVTQATKTIQLGQTSSIPHGAQKIVMAPQAGHGGISVSISKPGTQQIVASAILPGSVAPVTTTTSLNNTQTIPIAKVTPRQLEQLKLTTQPLQVESATPVTTHATGGPAVFFSTHGAARLPAVVTTAISGGGSGAPQQPQPLHQDMSIVSTHTELKQENRPITQMIHYPYTSGAFDAGGHSISIPQYQNIGVYSQLAHGSTHHVINTQSSGLRPTIVNQVTSLNAASLHPASSRHVGQMMVMEATGGRLPVRNNNAVGVSGMAGTSLTGTIQTVHIPNVSQHQQQSQTAQQQQQIQQQQQQQQQQLQGSPHPGSQPVMGTPGTPSASPRPSILRKRPHDSQVISKKVLPFTLEAGSPRQDGIRSITSSPKPHVMDAGSREASRSSTDTASSADSSTNSPPTTLEMTIKTEPSDGLDSVGLHYMRDGTSSVEASPRKKPRKQLLNVNEELKDEVMSTSSTEDETETQGHEPDMSTPERVELKDELVDDDGVRWVAMRKRNNIALMNFYSCSWKAKNNHFLRHADVKPKDERRPTVNELSNQKGIQQKTSGWKLYHLAAQLDDLVVLETDVKQRMAAIQVELAPQVRYSSHYSMAMDETAMIHELTQGNIQRSQLIIDQIEEARSSMLKLLEHKKKVSEIVSKHHSRRPVKKKERT